MDTENVTPWVCIGRTGTFHDSQGRPHTFTEADLEQIRAGYDPAKSEAPLVFGHPKDCDPAYGWIAGLKREGEKLFAQLAPDVQEALLFLPKIEKGRDRINERLLRTIAGEPVWAKQRELWKNTSILSQ
jgi:hypothetical protein